MKLGDSPFAHLPPSHLIKHTDESCLASKLRWNLHTAHLTLVSLAEYVLERHRGTHAS